MILGFGFWLGVGFMGFNGLFGFWSWGARGVVFDLKISYK